MLRNPRIKLLPVGPYIEIDGGSLFLGRDCHLAQHITALINKVVSNRHCCMRTDGTGRWTLEDLGSTNGTWLRGVRLAGPMDLTPGDVLSLGRAGPQFQWEPAETLAAVATMLEGDLATTDPDGSDERPFKVGRTPEIALHHERTGHTFTAKGYTVAIGRDPSAQVVIRAEDERHVSGRHVEIQFRSDGRVVVRDLGSKNGSWLNDKPLKAEGTAPARAEQLRGAMAGVGLRLGRR